MLRSSIFRLANKQRLLHTACTHARHFSGFKGLKDEIKHDIPEEFIKREKEAFEQHVEQRKRMLLNAERLALREINEDPKQQERYWWHRLAAMDEEELEMLPMGFTLKYGAFVNKLEEYHLIRSVERSGQFEDRYERVRHLDRLLTNEEVAEIEQMKEDNAREPVNNLDNYELANYMKR